MDLIGSYGSSDDESAESIDQSPSGSVNVSTTKSDNKYDFFNLENDDDLLDKNTETELAYIRSNIELQERTWDLHEAELGATNSIVLSNEAHRFQYRKPNDPMRVIKDKRKINTNTLSSCVKEGTSHCHEELITEVKSIPSTERQFTNSPSQLIFMTNGGTHKKTITSLKWNPVSHNYLLSSSLDGCIKIWNTFTRKCAKTFNCSDVGLKAALWTKCGKNIITGGFSKHLQLIDAETGAPIITHSHDTYISSLAIHPSQDSVTLSGSKEEILAWDLRGSNDKPIRHYHTKFGQVLDIAFLNESEFVCSTDCVNRESADRTIMAWDFLSGTLLSNQIYQERYTSPCLRVDPKGNYFLAQTQGGYIAIFSTNRPYKMNKAKCYKGHMLSGYGIQCDIGCSGKFVVSGDINGSLFFYDAWTTQLLSEIKVFSSCPLMCVACHPTKPNCVALASWNGEICFAK